MGLSSRKLVYAWHRHAACGADDQLATQTQHACRQERRRASSLISATLAGVFLSAFPLAAETLRIATFHTDLRKDGPGLLLRDILRGDPQIEALAQVIAHAKPDVIALQGFDWDLEGHALSAFQSRLEVAGHPMPERVALAPNTGRPSGFDLDGDGRTGEPEDALTYGRYSGQGGMAVLSRVPLGEVTSFTHMKWQDLPDPLLPGAQDEPFPAPEAISSLPLSSVAHWDIEVRPETAAPFHLLTFHANTPVFDGPEDRHGRRNADEIRFWQLYLDGQLAFAPPTGPIVIAGDANLDPFDGEGRHDAITALLADERVQDPRPRSAGGKSLADAEHAGDPALDTVDWPDGKPGNLRVSYVLADARLRVIDSGVIWPRENDPMSETVQTASRHRLVWVDIAF